MSDSTSIWNTPVMRDADAEPIGVALFLTTDDLAEMDISVDGTDILQYRITDAGYVEITTNNR